MIFALHATSRTLPPCGRLPGGVAHRGGQGGLSCGSSLVQQLLWEPDRLGGLPLVSGPPQPTLREMGLGGGPAGRGRGREMGGLGNRLWTRRAGKRAGWPRIPQKPLHGAALRCNRALEGGCQGQKRPPAGVGLAAIRGEGIGESKHHG